MHRDMQREREEQKHEMQSEREDQHREMQCVRGEHDRELQHEQDYRTQLADRYEGQMSRMLEKHEFILRENMLLHSRPPPSDLTRRDGGVGFSIVADSSAERDSERGGTA